MQSKRDTSILLEALCSLLTRLAAAIVAIGRNMELAARQGLSKCILLLDWPVASKVAFMEEGG
jgi:hypothetical protein